MKNKIKQCFTLFFTVIFLSPVYSQGNFYNYTNANISFWYPDNWVTSEHLLLLLMPKSEDLQLQFRISESVNLNEAVKESLNELKILYPDDTNIIVKDYTINKLVTKEIDAVIQGNKVYYLLIKTPKNKIIKLNFTADKETVLKYNEDIRKIIKSLKPKE